MKEDIKKQGISDPTEYIEKHLAGLKLDPEQKRLLKEGLGDEKSY